VRELCSKDYERAHILRALGGSTTVDDAIDTPGHQCDHAVTQAKRYGIR
jgi:hypothetical protein